MTEPYPTSGIRALLVAEGSGGHVIPALEVARALRTRQASVVFIYAARHAHMRRFVDALMAANPIDGLQLHPVSLPAGSRGWWGRLRQARLIWQCVRQQFQAFHPNVVVGFGGASTVPAIAAARLARIPTLIHEQNAVLGRANRLVARWADRVALSFPQNSHASRAPAIVTGLPIRVTIGHAQRSEAAVRFGFDAQAPTILVLGGSQGAHAVNTAVCRMLQTLPEEERRQWQFVHLTGPADEAEVRKAYHRLGLRARVEASMADMAPVYAVADVAIARAGASTVMELARCALPAVLIPYPHAAGHQRDNARAIESAGGAICLEEPAVTPPLLATAVRRLMRDQALRAEMSGRLHHLVRPDAAHRLAQAIAEVTRPPRQTAIWQRVAPTVPHQEQLVQVS